MQRIPPDRKVSEEGFLSILGCCLLTAVVFCGMALTGLARNEAASLNRCQAEVRLYYAAKSCMEEAVVSLEKQQIKDASDRFQDTVKILETHFSERIDVQVFAREKDGAILLMSRAGIADLDGWPAYQALYGYMTKESDHYVWAGWFEQDN